MKNANLHKAKKEKNDEFYTRLVDIENELRFYKDFFRGKVVLCNCDDPRVSNFFHYFSYNFEKLGLKKLITTCYKNQERDLFTQHNSDRAIWLEYNGDRNGNNVPDPDEIGIHYFEGDGSFDSPECVELLKQADVVVTNPPFSLARAFIKLLVDHDKKFLIIGNQNGITYKEIFPLIRDNKLWLGNTMVKEFVMPDGNTKKFGNICWFTNIPHNKRNEPLVLTEHFSEDKYPRYDNYLAWNVDKVADIPMDDYIDIVIDKVDLEKYKSIYDIEVLEDRKIRIHNPIYGVPITFLYNYCPEQFEIIWRGGDIEWCENSCEFYTPPAIEKTKEYKRQDRTWRIQNPYLVDSSGKGQTVYQRIFICKK